MTCSNIKTHFVKMHDTKFYCCDFASEIIHKSMTRLKLWIDAGFKQCPNCGQRLSING